MADITKIANGLDTRVLIIGGVVVVGAIAAYELLKGTSSSQSAGSTSGTAGTGSTSSPSAQNPTLTPNNMQSGSTSSFTPTITPTNNFTLPTNPTVSGNNNYTITSVYAPNNSQANTTLIAPNNSVSTESSLNYSPLTYTATITNNNQKHITQNEQKYQYHTGGVGSGLNIGSPNGILSSGINGI